MRFSAGPDGKPKAFRTAERQSRLRAVGLVCHHILQSSIDEPRQYTRMLLAPAPQYGTGLGAMDAASIKKMF